MASFWLGFVAVVCWQFSSAINVARSSGPADAVKPELVIPGEWMTDKTEHFLFLPLTVPDNASMVPKVMTNGESLLVVVTERPEEQPETNALKKYKLMMQAIKDEVGSDESLLQSKLQTWFDTEDDDEVKAHVEAALDSLQEIREAKDDHAHKSISVSLGISHPGKAASSFFELDKLQKDSPPALHAAADSRVLPALLRGASQTSVHHHHHHATRIIKESFAVEIPFPVPTENIASVKVNASTLIVAMPLLKKSLEAKGISTGGKPFLRIPVFNDLGHHMVGPQAEFKSMIEGINLKDVVSQKGFKPLEE